jgi:hypothetical protein
MPDEVKRIMDHGALAEGAKCGVYARRVEWKGLRKDPITQKNMTLYELDRNCSVEITEEMTLTEEEKAVRKELGVHLCKGDKLTADAIRLFVDVKRNSVKFEVKEGQTGTHGGSLASTNKRTVGQIKTPLANFMKQIEDKKKNQKRLENKQ